MTYQEYITVANYNYGEYQNYLKEKNGVVKGNYFSETFVPNNDIKRRNENLFIHHIKEDTIANLSNLEVAKQSPYEYQHADNLIYADLLEHILAHILIGEQNKGLGFGGAEIMIAQANDIAWNEDEQLVLDALKERLRNSLAVYETLLTHNQTVFYELDNTLATNDRALVVIGTGLGKTTTALAYIRKYGMRALVLGPNTVITQAWSQEPDVDVMTYQGFMNRYSSIDFSKYGVLICDEAHHCAAPRWGEGIRYALDNKLIKVIGLTATPKESKKEKDNYTTSENFFSGCICKGFSVLDGIEREIIHDFSYVGAIYDTTGLKEKYANISDTTLLGELDLAINNTPTVKTILTKHMPNNKRKGIIFVSNISAMDEAEVIMREIFPNAEYRRMHSLMPGAEVEENREWFQNTNEGYLLAVNMISEGAHYRGVNTIIMFRRTQSSLVFNQQLGRIITLARDEDPHAIVFDLVNNAENLDTEKSFCASLRESYAARKARGGRTKSEQIIVEDYAEKISEVLKTIAEATSHFWTEEEKETLRQYYTEHSEGKIDLTELLPLLPRHNRTQIINEASFLGITNNKKSFWTSEEDEILNQYYSTMGSKIIELLPDRSNQAILQRASKLGLKYEIATKWTEVELDVIYTYFPLEGIAGVEKRLPNRDRKSIQAKACSLGVKMDNPNINRKGSGYVPVMLLETGRIYASIAEAHLVTGDSVSEICNCCQGKAYSTNEHHYLYASDPRTKNPKKAIEEIEMEKVLNNPHNKPVRCKTTGEIFISYAAAKKKYPTACKIGACCKGEKGRKTSGKLPDGTPLEWEDYKKEERR